MRYDKTDLRVYESDVRQIAQQKKDDKPAETQATEKLAATHAARLGGDGRPVGTLCGKSADRKMAGRDDKPTCKTCARMWEENRAHHEALAEKMAKEAEKIQMAKDLRELESRGVLDGLEAGKACRLDFSGARHHVAAPDGETDLSRRTKC